MAVNIELTYGKKLGLPEYSSHNFSVSLKAEVATLEDVPGEVERVYRILQASVDEQIVNPGYVPGGEHKDPNGNGHGKSEAKAWKCSDKQKALILKIVAEHHLDRDEVEELAVSRFGHGVVVLNKLEASGLIDELLGKAGRSTTRQQTSGRTYMRRAA